MRSEGVELAGLYLICQDSIAKERLIPGRDVVTYQVTMM